MIFVTIGTQEPFDRLIKVIDEIAPALKGIPVIAQVSKTNYKAKNIQTLEFISPTEFNTYFAQAQLIVSHAGMGTIISALEQEKPIIVMPRLVKYKEHRSDHQLATANKFEALNYVHVAYNETELKNKLITVLHSNLKPLHKLGKYASKELLTSIEDFIVS
jgi:UDP-N-acetylglucosamine transferase subunit ALG13